MAGLTERDIPIAVAGAGFYLGLCVAVASMFLWYLWHWSAAVVGVIVCIVLAVRDGLQLTERTNRELESACKAHGLERRQSLEDVLRTYYLAAAENGSRLLLWYRKSDEHIHEVVVDLRDVLNLELIVGDKTVFKAGPAASVSAAALGGLAFGGAGAIVGSIVSGQTGRGKIGKVLIRLRVNDIERPIVDIPFISSPVKASDADAVARIELAERWVNAIEVLRHRLTTGVESPPTRPQ